MANILPQVFLLSVFKRLEPDDLRNATKVCREWGHVGKTARFIKEFKPVTDVEMWVGGISGPPVTSKKPQKCFLLKTLFKHKIGIATRTFNSLTVLNLLNRYPNVTKLLITYCSDDEYQLMNISQLFSTDHWGGKLRELEIRDYHRDVPVSTSTSKRFFDAINQMPVLKKLKMCLLSELRLQELSILKNLELVSLEHRNESDLLVLLKSAQKYAKNNPVLKMELPRCLREKWFPGSNFYDSNPLTTSITIQMEKYVRDRIVLINDHPPTISHLSHLEKVSSYYNNLTSLSLWCSFLTHSEPIMVSVFEPMFKSISENLRSLTHLTLEIDFTNVSLQKWLKKTNTPRKPTSRMASVKTLNLIAFISEHSDINWLNCNYTMPNLTRLNVKTHCTKCKIRISDYGNDVYKTKQWVVVRCMANVGNDTKLNENLKMKGLFFSVGHPIGTLSFPEVLTKNDQIKKFPIRNFI